jgi:hypothetical protein
VKEIHIKLRSGETRKFLEVGRPGGSWTISVRYEGGMVIISDEWGKEIAIPQELVAEVETFPDPSRF